MGDAIMQAHDMWIGVNDSLPTADMDGHIMIVAGANFYDFAIWHKIGRFERLSIDEDNFCPTDAEPIEWWFELQEIPEDEK